MSETDQSVWQVVKIHAGRRVNENARSGWWTVTQKPLDWSLPFFQFEDRAKASELATLLNARPDQARTYAAEELLWELKLAWLHHTGPCEPVDCHCGLLVWVDQYRSLIANPDAAAAAVRSALKTLDVIATWPRDSEGQLYSADAVNMRIQAGAALAFVEAALGRQEGA